MIIIDNYDSFTYNLVEYFRILGVEPKVFQNDKITLNEIKKLDFTHIVISPGWGNPDNSGISIPLIAQYYSSKKILGVCLGHQCICQYFGGEIVKATKPMHGKVSEIFFNNKEGIFKDIKSPINVTRYHSLIVKNELPKCLKIIAKTAQEEIMAVKHTNFNVYGLQFHPEAILTDFGIRILENFIKL